MGGGVIPTEDIPFLEERGIAAVFTPGTSIHEVVEFIESRRQDADDNQS
jgi:methylmalonyl-CoA mutase C-terminal domain/subunit